MDSNCFNCKYGLIEPRGNLGKLFGYCTKIKGKWETLSMSSFYEGCTDFLKEVDHD